MGLRRNQIDVAAFLKAAERVLGRACLPFDVDSSIEEVIRNHSARPRVLGIGDTPAVRGIGSIVDGHWTKFGMNLFTVRLPDRQVDVIRMLCPDGCESLNPTEDVWAVATEDYRRLYRFLREQVRAEHDHHAPLMRSDDRQRLWDNTIGFLQRGREALLRFGVSLKRGVMLLGEPGNGKTMAARWLESEAWHHGLEWRTVSAENFDQYSSRARAHELFDLSEPGIVLFDDFDHGLRDRTDTTPNRDQSTFLSNLDGFKTRSGVVYLFTSNLKLHELDPAARRPGRIDLFVEFSRPDAELRRQFFVEHWVAEARDDLPLDEAVRSTDGFSFAELDELKKLLVLRYLDAATWDWSWARYEFDRRTEHDRDQPRIGFAAALPSRTRHAREQRTQA